MNEAYIIPEVECSVCHTRISKGLPYKSERTIPRKGDYMLCGKCATLGQWDGELYVAPLNDLDMLRLIFLYPAYYFEYCRVSAVIKEKIKDQ